MIGSCIWKFSGIFNTSELTFMHQDLIRIDFVPSCSKEFFWRTVNVPWSFERCPATSLSKQPTFGDATTGFPAKWRVRNERRNSILMTRHYSDLGSVSNWSCRVGNLIQPIRSTTQIWVVTRHQYGISVLLSQTSFGGELVVASPNFGSFLRLPCH